MSTLWLIGMMGAGKSTVARAAAAALGMKCIDVDEVVASASGRTVAEWFAADMVGFRRQEADLVRRIAGDPAVVACGGGIVLDADAVRVMRASGLVLWLDAPAAVLATRVGRGEGRPLLGEQPAADLERILEERRGAYRKAAHAVVATGGAVEGVTATVVAAWQNRS